MTGALTEAPLPPRCPRGGKVLPGPGGAGRARGHGAGGGGSAGTHGPRP